jgi:LysM repeat protein
MNYKIALVLFLLCVQAGFGIAGTSLDSLGLESLDGKYTVIHKVDAGQTVYAIARRYSAKVNDIFAANPGLKENGLKVGSVIRVPYIPSVAPVTTTSTVPNTTSTISPVTAKQHTVEKGQTLFSIARLYKVSVADIKKWNGLDANEVKLGQVLTIGEGAAVSPSNAVASSDPNAIPITSTISIGPSGFKKITETGLAELNDITDPISKYRAWHKTAPYGAILLVTNETNGTYTFVRVVGTLIETGANKGSVIRLSREAWDKISTDGKPLKVKVEYTP